MYVFENLKSLINYSRVASGKSQTFLLSQHLKQLHIMIEQ